MMSTEEVCEIIQGILSVIESENRKALSTETVRSINDFLTYEVEANDIVVERDGMDLIVNPFGG